MKFKALISILFIISTNFLCSDDNFERQIFFDYRVEIRDCSFEKNIMNSLSYQLNIQLRINPDDLKKISRLILTYPTGDSVQYESDEIQSRYTPNNRVLFLLGIEVPGYNKSVPLGTYSLLAYMTDGSLCKKDIPVYADLNPDNPKGSIYTYDSGELPRILEIPQDIKVWREDSRIYVSYIKKDDIISYVSFRCNDMNDNPIGYYSLKDEFGYLQRPGFKVYYSEVDIPEKIKNIQLIFNAKTPSSSYDMEYTCSSPELDIGEGISEEEWDRYKYQYPYFLENLGYNRDIQKRSYGETVNFIAPLTNGEIEDLEKKVILNIRRHRISSFSIESLISCYGLPSKVSIELLEEKRFLNLEYGKVNFHFGSDSWKNPIETRLEYSDTPFIFNKTITIGTDFNEVIENIGIPDIAIYNNKKVDWEESYILFKNMDGISEQSYIDYIDQGIRCFFSNGKLSAMYLMKDRPDIMHSSERDKYEPVYGAFDPFTSSDEYNFYLRPVQYTLEGPDGDYKVELQELKVLWQGKEFIYPLYSKDQNRYSGLFVENIEVMDIIGDNKKEIILDGQQRWRVGFHGGDYKKKILLNISESDIYEIFSMRTSALTDIEVHIESLYFINNKYHINQLEIDQSSAIFGFSGNGPFNYTMMTYSWDNGKFIRNEVKPQLKPTVNTENLRLREAPNLDAKRIYLLQPDSIINILDKSETKQIIGDMEDYWYKVQVLESFEEVEQITDEHSFTYESFKEIKTGWAFGHYITFE